jgi:hypothetical protein
MITRLAVTRLTLHATKFSAKSLRSSCELEPLHMRPTANFPMPMHTSLRQVKRFSRYSSNDSSVPVRAEALEILAED